MWSNTIGHDPYAADTEAKARQEQAARIERSKDVIELARQNNLDQGLGERGTNFAQSLFWGLKRKGAHQDFETLPLTEEEDEDQEDDIISSSSHRRRDRHSADKKVKKKSKHKKRKRRYRDDDDASSSSNSSRNSRKKKKKHHTDQHKRSSSSINKSSE